MMANMEGQLVKVMESCIQTSKTNETSIQTMYDAEVNRLKTELKQARLCETEANRLKAELKEMKLCEAEVNRLRAELKEMKACEAELNRVKAELEEIRLCEAEVNRLKAELKVMKVCEAEVNRLTAQLNEARLFEGEVNRLKTELRQARLCEDEVNRLKAEVDELRTNEQSDEDTKKIASTCNASTQTQQELCPCQCEKEFSELHDILQNRNRTIIDLHKQLTLYQKTETNDLPSEKNMKVLDVGCSPQLGHHSKTRTIKEHIEYMVPVKNGFSALENTQIGEADVAPVMHRKEPQHSSHEMHSQDGDTSGRAQSHHRQAQGRPDTQRVLGFRGFKNPLSNFFPCTIEEGGMVFSSSEHMFQYRKAQHHHDERRAQSIKAAPTAFGAKVIGDEIKVNDSWRSIQKAVMENIVMEKFKASSKFRNCLMSTGKAILAETTKDLFWAAGVPPKMCRSTADFKGANVLGKILMNLREAKKSTTPEVLILCDSHGHRLDTNKINSNKDIYKRTTYTISEARAEISNTTKAPNQLYIQVGTNHLHEGAGNVIAGLKDLITECKQTMPQCKLAVGAIPPVKDRHRHPDIKCINREMDIFCKDHDVLLVHNDNILQCMNPFRPDGVHLTEESFLVLANNMALAINKTR
jgi:ribA/ribD-fused uncharacterized protein